MLLNAMCGAYCYMRVKQGLYRSTGQVGNVKLEKNNER